jgi:hypothetical protein
MLALQYFSAAFNHAAQEGSSSQSVRARLETWTILLKRALELTHNVITLSCIPRQVFLLFQSS